MGTAPVGALSATIARRLRRAWRELGRDGPTKPNKLWLLLKAAHEYPHEAIYPLSPERAYVDSREIAVAYDALRRSARELQAVLERKTPNYFLLGPDLFEGLTSVEYSQLRALEGNLPFLSALPDLPLAQGQRVQTEMGRNPKKPRSDVDAYPRAIALAVGWYVMHIEGGKLRVVDDDEGVPTSREGRLYSATLKGLGVSPRSKPFTHLMAARKRLNLKDNAPSDWDIIQEIGVALRG